MKKFIISFLLMITLSIQLVNANYNYDKTLSDIMGIESSDSVQMAYMIDVDNCLAVDLTDEQLEDFINASTSITLSPKVNPNPFSGVAIVIETQNDIFTYFINSGIQIGKYGDENYLCYSTDDENDVIDTMYAQFMSSKNKISSSTFQINEKYDYLSFPSELYALSDIEFAAKKSLLPYSISQVFGNKISREEMCILIANFICVNGNYKSLDGYLKQTNQAYLVNVFSDCVDSDSSIDMLYALGIVNGKDNGLFNPNDAITREQAAVIIKKVADLFCVNSTESMASFSDSSEISEWANDSVNFVSGNGIMKGMDNGNFCPKDLISVEQAVIAVNRLYKMLN